MSIVFNINRKSFDPKRVIRFLIFGPIFLLIVKIGISYHAYINLSQPKIEVMVRDKNYRLDTKDIPHGQLEFTKKANYVIKAKSFGEYLFLDSNPNKSKPLSLFFCINFLVIAWIMIYGLRKSTQQNLYTTEFIKSITILYCYLFFMMILNLIHAKGFEAYIENLSEDNVRHYAFDNLSIIQYNIMIIFLGFILNFLKKGLELQEEQDLTV